MLRAQKVDYAFAWLGRQSGVVGPVRTGRRDQYQAPVRGGGGMLRQLWRRVVAFIFQRYPSTMKVTFSAVLKLDPDRSMRLGTPIEFTSPAGLQVLIQDRADEPHTLDATLEAETSDPAELQPLVKAEVERLANILAWQRKMIILSARATGYRALQEDGRQSRLIFAETVHVSAHLGMVLMQSPESVEKLTQHLATDAEDEMLEAITLWRDAAGQSSDTTRYFLLYRIMEDLLGSRKNVDNWILAKHPATEQRPTKGGMATVFTYLRDNIHPKGENPRFPFGEVAARVDELQDLVEELIPEKFPSAARS